MSHSTSTSANETDSSDAESASSSVVYEQEPFETFRVLVLELAQNVWNGLSVDDIVIERMTGGGFNRIIGVSIKSPGQEKSIEYILRIPRFDAAQLDRDVAALFFVRTLGDIPVPTVLAFDETANNKLGSPYMIQTRLPGTGLLSAFPELDHSNKCRIAADLGRVYHRMLSTKSSVAGVFSLAPSTSNSETEPRSVTIAPFFDTEASTLSKDRSGLSTQALLTTTVESRKANGLRHLPLDTLRPKLMDRIVTMASELHDDSWFQGDHVSLCHLDLEPRNILIGTTTTTAHPGSAITGILDWDSAVLAPSFMSCAPPLWIWAWAEDEEEDERTANDTPPTEEGVTLKRIFEDAAGPEYVRYAYSPAYRLARRLVRFAIGGIRSSEDVREAQAMLREWTEVRQSLKCADTTLAAALNAFPQSSTEPYRQQQQLVFGRNQQTPGRAAVPATALDPNFRAAASTNMMIWGFVKSMDDMAMGKSS